MALEPGTTVYFGNLKTKLRIIELKSNLLKLFTKVLKININSGDIGIVNGSKRYAIIDVHNDQNVDYILANLVDHADRRKLKFNFESIVEPDNYLHVDTVKSQDDKQARDDFENAKNPLRPFQRPHLHVRKRPDYGRVVSLRPGGQSGHGGGATPNNTFGVHSARPHSPRSTSTQKSHTNNSEPPTDLDTTLDDYPVDRDRSPAGEALNRHVNMVKLDDSTLKVTQCPK